MQDTKNNKKLFTGVIALAIAVCAFAALFFIFREKPVEGSKNITISVTGSDGEITGYELRTDAEYLKQAMEEAEGLTFSGREDQFGLMVDTINGETATVSENGAYWSFYVNDEYCQYGIDSQPVKDGDKFGIVYTVYVEE